MAIKSSSWPSRGANDRLEILDELFADLYEWAQANGETKSYADYVSAIKTKLAAYEDIKLRNTSLGNYPAEDGSTEFFLNVPKYFFVYGYSPSSNNFVIIVRLMLSERAEMSIKRSNLL